MVGKDPGLHVATQWGCSEPNPQPECGMIISERERLLYDVMGIALAIRGHLGECTLYRELDAAITEQNWRKLAIIQNAFEMLAPERCEIILGDTGHMGEIHGAVAMFEGNLRSMVPHTRSNIA